MISRSIERLFWNRYANSYDKLAVYYQPYQSLVMQVCDHIDDFAKGRSLKILDAGCGTGNYAFELARRGHEVVGIDRSPSMIARAEQKKLSTALKTPPKILVHDLNQPLPFKDKSFDAAISVHVLCALSDGEKFISELRRVTGKQSIVLLVNSAENLSIGKAIKPQWEILKGPGRLSYLIKMTSVILWNLLISLRERTGVYQLTTGEQLQSLLKSAGAQEIQVHEAYVGSVLAIGSWPEEKDSPAEHDVFGSYRVSK